MTAWPTVVEWIGYLASLLVAASLMMSNITRLRWCNLVGASVFVGYAAVVGAWPVFAVNLFVVFVDAYYLTRTRRERDFFELLPIEGADAFLQRFVRFHADDIARYFPRFGPESASRFEGCFVLRNMLPVGLVLFEARAEGEVEVRLDYVIREYRDMKNAEFAYRKLNERFRARGFRALVVRDPPAIERDYLRRVGYEALAAEPNVFRKQVV